MSELIEKPRQCFFCHKDFPYNGVRLIYMRETGENRLACSTCQKKHTYFYPNEFTFYHNNESKPRLYYGIELETAFTYKTYWKLSDFLADLPEQLFCIDDGSIYDSSNVRLGMEVVSHPMTLNYMQEHKDIWDYVLAWARKGLNSYRLNSCGMHIHVSKDYFNNDHLLNFIKLIYAIQDLAIKLSQRKSHDLERWATFNRTSFSKLNSNSGELRSLGNKYNAINLYHPHTIEIRMFRGTLANHSFWKNIEFMQACVECSKNTDKFVASKDETTQYCQQLYKDVFVQYIKDNKDRFENLYNFLEKRDLL